MGIFGKSLSFSGFTFLHFLVMTGDVAAAGVKEASGVGVGGFDAVATFLLLLLLLLQFLLGNGDGELEAVLMRLKADDGDDDGEDDKSIGRKADAGEGSVDAS